MFTLLLRLKRRLKRLLKVQTESRQVESKTLRSRSVKFAILIATGLGVGILYPGEVIYDPLDVPRRGEFAPEDIRAPFQITIFKDDREIRREQNDVRLSTPFLLQSDTSVVTAAINRLKRYGEFIDSLKMADTTLLLADSLRLYDQVARRYTSISQSAIRKSLHDTASLEPMVKGLAKIYRESLYQVGILNELGELPTSRNRTVIVRKGANDLSFDRGRILDITLANARLTTDLNRLAATEPIDVDMYYHVGRNFIRPNLTVDMEEYNRRVNEGLEQLTTVKRTVNANDVIVSARDKVTADQEEILLEMIRLQRSQAAKSGWWAKALPAAVRVLLTVAALGALYIFLFVFRPEVYRSNQRILAIVMVFLLQLALVSTVDWLSVKFDISSSYIYPVAVLPIMITILFDAELGILSAIIAALFLGFMNRFSFNITLLTALTGIVGSLSSGQVRKRSDFYRVMLAVMVSYVVLVLVVENLKLSPNQDILTDVIIGMSISVLSIMIVMGVLPVFESMFGITTATTLLELSDLNHPLLRRLSIEAPGTYHHSISVGNLCESAAEAIGGNPLLARVGAYYHDIGKIEIPEYFVENQFSVRSKHESLTPTMSALILSSHVKKGRLLGEEADIPDDVLNFIEEHHGTMVMSYFYHKAKEQGGEDVSPDKFRYPGPKPQIRETGIAMLADAVEAASRTLDDPKPARIDSLIQRIINDRFQSGELDECPLTLRDLAKIKVAFAQVLIAAFHHRVRYPAGEGQ